MQENVIHDVNFVLQSGESLAIVAPSGFGKSTLLSIAGLLLQPSSGKVLFENKPVSTKSRAELLGMGGISWILQSPTLFPRRTALDNVLIGNLVSGLRREYFTEQAKQILIAVGLGHRISSAASALSGGEKQRVAVARALFSQPKLIIADEPTANLDRKTADKIAESIFTLSQESAVLVATHDPLVADLADRVLEPDTSGSFQLR